MEQFTFYELYADILQSMDDVSAGKLASCICAYEFEDKEPAGELSDRENFYWRNIADILKEVKETERAGKVPKKFNLQSRHAVAPCVFAFRCGKPAIGLLGAKRKQSDMKS